MNLLISIPCLNEEDTIGEVISLIPERIEDVSNIDVLVINDGSLDRTAEIANELGAVVISHKKNLGVGEAFKSAYNYAVDHNYDLMVNIDGDNQFDPRQISELVNPILKNKADLVIGSRFLENKKIPNQSRIKYIGNKIMALLIGKLIDTKQTDVSSGFRAYSREALYNLNIHGSFTYTQETFIEFSAKNLTIQEIPVKIKYFKKRQSRVVRSLYKYIANTLIIIIRGYRDFFPLRFFGMLSIIFLFPSIVFSSIFFLKFLSTGQFTGNLYAGFLGGFFIFLSLVFGLIGLVADMLDRIRTNQEKILYRLKKQQNQNKQN
jgi:glycosyltransferase involved in cell wall biosynthesis